MTFYKSCSAICRLRDFASRLTICQQLLQPLERTSEHDANGGIGLFQPLRNFLGWLIFDVAEAQGFLLFLWQLAESILQAVLADVAGEGGTRSGETGDEQLNEAVPPLVGTRCSQWHFAGRIPFLSIKMLAMQVDNLPLGDL